MVSPASSGRLAFLRDARSNAIENQAQAQQGGAGLRRLALDFLEQSRAQAQEGRRAEQFKRTQKEWRDQDRTTALGQTLAEQAYADPTMMETRFRDGQNADQAVDALPGMGSDFQPLQFDDQGNEVSEPAPQPGAVNFDVGEQNTVTAQPPAQPGPSGMEGFGARDRPEVREVVTPEASVLADQILQQMHAKGFKETTYGEALALAQKHVSGLSETAQKMEEQRVKRWESQREDAREDIEDGLQNASREVNLELDKRKLAEDLPHNVGVAMEKWESKLIDAAGPPTEGEDTRDPEWLSIVAKMAKDLDIDRKNPEFQTLIKAEYYRRFRSVTSDLQKNKNVTTPGAIASFIKKGLLEKPTVKQEKKPFAGVMSNSALEKLSDIKTTIQNVEETVDRTAMMDRKELSSYATKLLNDARSYFNAENLEFSDLAGMSMGVRADFIKSISGAAVNEAEAKRLAEVLPGMDKNPELFIMRWNDFRDRQVRTLKNKVKANVISGKITQEQADQFLSGIDTDEFKGRKTSYRRRARSILNENGRPVFKHPSKQGVRYPKDMDDVEALLEDGWQMVGSE